MRERDQAVDQRERPEPIEDPLAGIGSLILRSHRRGYAVPAPIKPSLLERGPERVDTPGVDPTAFRWHVVSSPMGAGSHRGILAVLALALALAPGLALTGAAQPIVDENPWQDRRVLHIAHQGGETEAPSNTLYAFETAVEKGADVLELDVHATEDRHLAVIHDATVDRTTDASGRVDNMTLEELKTLDAAYWFVPGEGADHTADEEDYVYRGVATGEVDPPEGFTANDFKIPTLDEVLTRFPDMLVNIEIKATAPDTQPYERLLAQRLAEHDRGEDTIVVSFNDHSTEAFRAFNQDVSTATGTAETAGFWATARGPAPGTPSHHHALQVPVTFEGIRVVTEDFVDDAHANGYAVHVWTIGDRATMNELVDMGVDGVMTDRPTVLEDVLQDRGVVWNG